MQAQKINYKAVDKQQEAKVSNWYKSSRTIKNKDWYKHPVKCPLFRFLLDTAQARPYETSCKGYQLTLQPGQLYCTLSTIVNETTILPYFEALGQGKSPMNSAVKAAKRALDFFVKEGSISYEKIGEGRHSFLIITLLKWSKYNQKSVTMSVTNDVTNNVTLEPHINQGLQVDSVTSDVTMSVTNVVPINKNDLKQDLNTNTKVLDSQIDEQSDQDPKIEKSKKNFTPYKKIWDSYQESLVDTPEDLPNLIDVQVLSKKRKSTLKKFWLIMQKDMAKVESYFKWIIDNQVNHSWLFGNNDRGWVADIEFICREETYARATENRLGDWG